MNIYIPEVEIDCLYVIYISDNPSKTIDEESISSVAPKNVKYFTVTVLNSDEQDKSCETDVSTVNTPAQNELKDTSANSGELIKENEVIRTSNSPNASRQNKSANAISSRNSVNDEAQNIATDRSSTNVLNELQNSCTNPRQPLDQNGACRNLNFLSVNKLYKITKIGSTKDGLKSGFQRAISSLGNINLQTGLKGVLANSGDPGAKNGFLLALNSRNRKKRKKSTKKDPAKKGVKNKLKTCSSAETNTNVEKKSRKKRSVFLKQQNQQEKSKSSEAGQNLDVPDPVSSIISDEEHEQEGPQIAHENLNNVEKHEKVLVTGENLLNSGEQVVELLTGEENVISNGGQNVIFIDENNSYIEGEIIAQCLEENVQGISENVVNEIQPLPENVVDSGLNNLLLACESVISSDQRDILQIACKNIENPDNEKDLQKCDENKASEAEKPFECDICHRRFRIKLYLRRHRAHHSTTKRYFCDVCGKGFTDSNYMRKHRDTHLGQLYSCGICGQKFKRKDTCKLHYAKHIGEKKYYECHLCERKFAKNFNLKSHLLTHNEVHPFQCNICSKKFSSDRTLSNHLRIHSGDRPFACDLCLKAFVTKPELQLHMAIHGEKKFLCDVCGKGFFHRCYLTDHKRMHTGEKPYVCKICDRRFSRRCSLKEHSYTHVKEKPFTCEVCPKAFSSPSNLRKHCLSHSNEVSSQK